MKVSQERLLAEQRAGLIKDLACREDVVGVVRRRVGKLEVGQKGWVGQLILGKGESWSGDLER